MSSFTNILDLNLSFYAIPAAWLISFAPKTYAIKLYNNRTKGEQFDVNNPRRAIAQIKNDGSIDEETRGIVSRADAAQMNGFENLGLFAAAVLAGNFARLDARWLNLSCLWYLVNRMIYNIVYTKPIMNGFGGGRGIPFIASHWVVIAMFIKAGHRARKGLI